MKKKYTIIASLAMLILSLVTIITAARKLKQNTNTSANNSYAADILTPDPNFTEFQGTLAPGFPDFPVYPGAQIVISRRETKAISNLIGFSAKWKIGGNKTAPKVSAWYVSQLVNKGYKNETNSNDNGQTEQTLKFTKDEQSVILSIEKGEDKNPDDIDVLVNIPVDKL